MHRRICLAEIILFLSLIIFFAYVVLARPPVTVLVLLLAPIALSAVLYEFVGGTLVALAAMIIVALLLALDPHPTRRAAMLQDVWPLLITYLAVGPFVGWLVARERERQEQLTSTARHLNIKQASLHKVESEPSSPRYILNVRGFGYRLATPEDLS